MIDFRRDDLNAPTDSSPHVCIAMYGSGYCWCHPRSITEIAHDVAVGRNLTLPGAAAILAFLRTPVPSNVVPFVPRRPALKGAGL